MIFLLIVFGMIYTRPKKSIVISHSAPLNISRDPLFIILMASYPRRSGQSPYYIKKAVRSVISQTYTNWELFITGDKFDNETEFRSLFSPIPASKLFIYNLAQPGERDNLTGMQLWQSGGVAAMNNALQRAEEQHKDCTSDCKIYFTNHDDDDIWSKDHLNEMLTIFRRFPSVVFAWTKGYYCHSGGNPYPSLLVPQDKVNNWPKPFGGNILHSSWAWNMKVFRGFRYRAQWDFPPNHGGAREADADLMEVVQAYIIGKKMDFYHSNQATIEHLVEMGRACAKNGPLWYPD